MQGYYQPARSDRRGDARRLVPDRRPRPPRRRRPPDHHRPQEGDDRARLGQEHLSRGDRGALPQVAASIKEICVVGSTRPDEPTTERLHAVIVPRPGGAEGPQDRQRRRPAALRDGGPRRRPAGPQAGARLRRVVRAAAAHDHRQAATLRDPAPAERPGQRARPRPPRRRSAPRTRSGSTTRTSGRRWRWSAGAPRTAPRSGPTPISSSTSGSTAWSASSCSPSSSSASR